MKKIAIIILVMLVSIAGLSTTTYANLDGSDFLVDVGKKELKRGNLDMALHEFSKALMINPDNEEAKKYLKEYGLDEGLYSGSQTSRTQKAKLAKKVKQYREDIGDLADQQKKMAYSFDMLEEQRNHLIEENMAKDKMLEDMAYKIDDVEKQARIDAMKLNEEKARMKEELARMQIITEEAMIPRKNVYVEGPSNVYLNHRKGDESKLTEAKIQKSLLMSDLRRVADKAAAYELELTALDNKIQDLEHRLDKRSNIQNKMIMVMKDYMAVREDRIHNSNDALVEKEFELAKINKDLMLKMNELVDLHEAYSMLQIDDKSKSSDTRIKSDINQTQDDIKKLKRDREHIIDVLTEQLGG